MRLLQELHKRTKENVALGSTVSKLGKPRFTKYLWNYHDVYTRKTFNFYKLIL